MSEEGTRQVQQEKSAKAQKNLKADASDTEADKNQQNFRQRNASTLERLQNLPSRPRRKVYQGNPEILVGLSIGLENPITAAVVNGRTGDVLTYRTPRTLLGKQYRLFNRKRN
jgi:hypothetical protein